MSKLPDGWENQELNNFVERITETFNPIDSALNLPCVELEHIQPEIGRLIGHTWSSEQKSIKNRFYAGQILFGKLRPYLRKYAHPDFNGVCSSEIWVLKALSDYCVDEFLFYLVQSERFISAANVSSGSKMPRADWTYMSNVLFSLPPLAEQRKIAEILSTWDEAIQLVEALIAALQERKRGLMQRLLTGEVRFPGFDDEWQEVRLGDVFTERNETGFNNLPLVSITANSGVVWRDDLDRKDTSSADKSKYLRICPNDIGYNTMRMWQGVSGISEIEGIVSPAYTICIPDNDIDVRFMGYLFKLPSTIHTFWRYSQGLVKDTLSLKFHNFADIELAIPKTKLEQSEIVTCLSSLDQYIGNLSLYSAALNQEKKGLMQRLLTGEVHVKVEQE